MELHTEDRIIQGFTDHYDGPRFRLPQMNLMHGVKEFYKPKTLNPKLPFCVRFRHARVSVVRPPRACNTDSPP